MACRCAVVSEAVVDVAHATTAVTGGGDETAWTMAAAQLVAHRAEDKPLEKGGDQEKPSSMSRTGIESLLHHAHKTYRAAQITLLVHPRVVVLPRCRFLEAPVICA